MADVAQVVRALDCGSGGRGFKSHHSPQYKRTKFFAWSFYIWVQAQLLVLTERNSKPVRTANLLSILEYARKRLSCHIPVAIVAILISNHKNRSEYEAGP